MSTVQVCGLVKSIRQSTNYCPQIDDLQMPPPGLTSRRLAMLIVLTTFGENQWVGLQEAAKRLPFRNKYQLVPLDKKRALDAIKQLERAGLIEIKDTLRDRALNITVCSKGKKIAEQYKPAA